MYYDSLMNIYFHWPNKNKY